MLVVCLLLEAAAGTWLSLAALYALLEPGQGTSGAPLIAALAVVLVGLVLIVRRVFGSAGLVPPAAVVVFAAAGIRVLA